jgi:hypothetical protein
MPFKDPIIAAAYEKEYREKNRERSSEKNRKYRNENPELIKLRKKHEYDKQTDAYKARAKANPERNEDKIKAFRSTPEYKEKKNAIRSANYVAHPLPRLTREQNVQDEDSKANRSKQTGAWSGMERPKAGAGERKILLG